jgi:hypothetical protein
MRRTAEAIDDHEGRPADQRERRHKGQNNSPTHVKAD